MFKREWVVVVALAAISVGAMAFAPPPTLGVAPGAEPTLEVDIERLVTDDARAFPSVMPSRTATATPSAFAASGWRTFDGMASRTPTPTPVAEPATTPFPFDTRPDLDRYIYIDQWTQHMYVFEYGKLVREIPASCGLPDSDKYTEPWSGQVGAYWGTFYAFDVFADEAWYLYMSVGSILIHSLPYTLQNGYKVYQDRDALGVRPASHGCVRIAPEDAAWLTQWNPEGVEATVTDPYLERWRSILSN